MIKIEVNGVLYKNFKRATFNESMIEFTNEATFTVALDGNETAPFLIGSECKVYVDDQKVITGKIYDANLEYENQAHNLEYIIRDKTADLSDSDLDNINDLSGSLSLIKIIEKIIQHLGADITVVNDYPELKNFDADSSDIKPSFGMNAFDYIDSLARKRQVLLSTNSEGQIQIFRNSGSVMSGRLQNSISKDKKDGNNIKSASFSKSLSNEFNKYVVRSQLGTAASKSPFGSGISNKSLVDQSGVYIDDNTAIGRQRCIISEQSATSEDNIERAKWEYDFATANSTSYNVTIQGHSIEGQIYKSNNLIQLIDDYARLNDKFLIKSVSMDYDVESGSNTTLELVDKNAFNVLVPFEEKEKTSKKNIFGAF